VRLSDMLLHFQFQVIQVLSRVGLHLGSDTSLDYKKLWHCQ